MALRQAIRLDLCRDDLLVGPVLVDIARIRESRRVENADLCKEMSCVLTTPTETSTYPYAVPTCEFIQTGRVGLALAVRTTLLVGTVEDIEVVAIDIFADKDIGDDFQQ